MKTIPICGIYKITNPIGQIYIGGSMDCEKRRVQHKYTAKKKPNAHRKLYNSIKKYGWENHEFEIISECKREELDNLEVYYINRLKCLNVKKGLNLKEGGLNGKHTKESIITMSKVQTNRSEEWRKNISNAKKVDKNPNYNKNFSKEVRHNMGEASKTSWKNKTRRKKAKESFTGAKNPKAKAVVNTTTKEIFPTIRAAWKSCGRYCLATFQLKLQGLRKNNTPFTYV